MIEGVWGVFARLENHKHCKACIMAGKRCGNIKGALTLVDLFESEEAAWHAIAVNWFSKDQLSRLYDPENRDWIVKELHIRDK